MFPTDQHSSALNKSAKGLAIAAGAVLSAPLALAGGWLAYSTLVIDHHLPLPPAIEADQQTLASTLAGALNVYVDR